MTSLTKREILQKIIKHNGECLDIVCQECPFYEKETGCCAMGGVSEEQMVEDAKVMLAELDKKEAPVNKFKVGDLCFSCSDGWREILNSKNELDVYPFRYVIKDKIVWFTREGRVNESDVAPTVFTKEEALVKFPEFPPPKRKIKKEIKRWAVIYKDKVFVTFTHEKDARRCYDSDSPKEGAIAITEFTIPYEVEE